MGNINELKILVINQDGVIWICKFILIFEQNKVTEYFIILPDLFRTNVIFPWLNHHSFSVYIYMAY